MTAPLRLQILSDLHRDVRPAEIVPSPDADVIVVAGDVCEGVERSLIYLRARIPAPTPIVFVAGNHEFYRHAVDEEIERGRVLAAELGIAFLDNAEAVIGGVRFLGCTLWTDYRLRGEEWQHSDMVTVAGRGGMNDHRLIAATKKPWRRWLPRDALNAHRASRAWLESALAEPFAGPTVIVAHHCPSQRSIPEKYAGQPMNSAYASNLDDLVGASGAALFVHGHTHSSFDYKIGSTRVLCNPHGYGDENPDFDPALIVETDRP